MAVAVSLSSPQQYAQTNFAFQQMNSLVSFGMFGRKLTEQLADKKKRNAQTHGQINQDTNGIEDGDFESERG